MTIVEATCNGCRKNGYKKETSHWGEIGVATAGGVDKLIERIKKQRNFKGEKCFYDIN